MKKKITVNVTKRDIERGAPRNSWYCPIALSMKRHKEFRKFSVVVSRSTVQVMSSLDANISSIQLPARAKIFITRFDRKLPVEPFKFTIETEVPE